MLALRKLVMEILTRSIIFYFSSGVAMAGVSLWEAKDHKMWTATGGPGKIGANATPPVGEA